MADIKGYNMPDELYYHKDHSWARVEGTRVTVGMNDFFQQEAGDVVFIDLPEEEDEVEQGEVCGKIQSRKWIGKLVSPVSGEIMEINEALDTSNRDCRNRHPRELSCHGFQENQGGRAGGVLRHRHKKGPGLRRKARRSRCLCRL